MASPCASLSLAARSCCSTGPDLLLVQGDNDPVDVVEIGKQALSTGGVYKVCTLLLRAGWLSALVLTSWSLQVKPLAVLAMIDDGELDWKVIAIRADDPEAAGLNDVEDVERCAAQLWAGVAAWEPS